jgi:hypothetical protein
MGLMLSCLLAVVGSLLWHARRLRCGHVFCLVVVIGLALLNAVFDFTLSNPPILLTMVAILSLLMADVTRKSAAEALPKA